MSLDSELLTPERTTAVDPPAPPDPPPAVEAATPTDPAEDALDPDLAAQVIDVPDSSADQGIVKLVPLSAVISVRQKLAETKRELADAKDGSAKATQLEARVQQLEGHLSQLAPKAEAYEAAVAAQQQTPRTPGPQDDPAARDVAVALDLYDAAGQPDLAKARTILGIVDQRAQQHAEARVAPLARHTIQQQSATMLARAKATVAPNGQQPDPGVLEAIWGRLDPALTATAEGAKQAWAVALGYSAAVAPSGAGAARGADGRFTPSAASTADATVAAPLVTEKAGGRDAPSSLPLNDHERKYLQESGLSEAEYLKSAPPWMRR